MNNLSHKQLRLISDAIETALKWYDKADGPKMYEIEEEEDFPYGDLSEAFNLLNQNNKRALVP